MKSQTVIPLDSLPSIIQIPPHESWMILDSGDSDAIHTIILEEGANLAFYSARTNGKLHIQTIHRGAHSTSNIRCTFRTSRGRSIESIVKSSFEADNASSEIHILSIADSFSDIFLDSAIDIKEGTRGIIGRLKERHVFLGSEGKIRGIPALIVHSDDMEATHALSIDRISDEELFYLRSRGFPRDSATMLILEGAITRIFEGLPESVSEAIKTQMLPSEILE